MSFFVDSLGSRLRGLAGRFDFRVGAAFRSGFGRCRTFRFGQGTAGVVSRLDRRVAQQGLERIQIVRQPTCPFPDKICIPRFRVRRPFDPKRHPRELQVLQSAVPRSSLIPRTAHRYRRFGQAIDVAISGHRVADMETRFRIERRYQRQIAGENAVAIFRGGRFAQQAVRQNADSGALFAKRPQHRMLVNPPSAARNDRISLHCGGFRKPFGKGHVVRVGIPRTDDRYAASIEKHLVAAAEQYRRRLRPQLALQSFGILRIRTGNRP